MDWLRVEISKTGNDFVISVTRNPDRWEAVDKNGKIITQADSKRNLKKKLKELNIEL